ncbi:MAG: translocase SpoIIIE [Chloroflexota bacterium]
MARRRRTVRTEPAVRRRRRRSALPSVRISADVGRSLVGLSLLLIGAILLIGLVLPGEGSLTDVLRDFVAPWFGAGRWLLPPLLIAGGWWVEWGPGSRRTDDWQTTVVGLVVGYLALLGLAETLGVSGGRIGRFLEEGVAGLITTPGAFILFGSFGALGLMIAFNQPLATVASPLTRGASLLAAGAGSVLARGERSSRGSAAATGGAGTRSNGTGRTRGVPAVASPGQTVAWGSDDGEAAAGALAAAASAVPVAAPSAAPTSSTFAPVRTGEPVQRGAVTERSVATTVAEDGDRGNGAEKDGDLPRPVARGAWELPPLEVLEEPGPPPSDANGGEMDHALNERIILAKLASFNIPATIVGRNAGPVVTQYEVQPAPEVKLSRIEALSDDLSMALAARSLRIEAPIPGKAAVGIEIPNRDPNVVKLRSILTELDFEATGSKTTFALGRNVAGEARAVDLSKMPHLLIAGATGSGKSVMVNALIASILCEATPSEVRLALMDLKKVELASYEGLPHLLHPVVTEPVEARRMLWWAVETMERRYQLFANATARNIRAYNERCDAEGRAGDRLPFIVIVIDELADLMMREGKNVEDPIVRLAQKARATGIHMVLATQRPSVNVVTGLIKANFPSRIAFAMASQIDSRTILDAPGAEDLIGRGDMLYQPSDLPKPIRMQGVFVSDREIGRIVEHWSGQAEPRYVELPRDPEVDGGSRRSGDLDDGDADPRLAEAVAVVQEYDRASASLLQRRLKIGYARAARMIDQLEERGYVGAFDGSNARQVLGGAADEPVGADDEDEDEPGR